MPTTLLSRTDVRAATACPRCLSKRGEPCRRLRYHRDMGWVREANHRERIIAAQRVREGAP